MLAKRVNIDIETFSSVSLKDAGVYKYAASEDFEIQLLSYWFDGGEAKCVSLATGDTLPKTLVAALRNPMVEKHAHNALFERTCLKAAGFDVGEVDAWHCTMAKAAYCGLPLGLDQLSKVLDLGDKAKMDGGKALIRYFAVPCKPTKANGGRTQNLPQHNPQKWEEYKQYNLQDVIAERAVADKLAHIEMPAMERKIYILDQKINDRGIEVDLDFARAAIQIDTRNQEVVQDRIIEITGLENPRSTTQLRKWLGARLHKEVTTIAKDAIPDLMEAGSDAVKEVLTLRQKSAKTSIKKYEAMLHSAGSDNRSRGLFQYYGANRTGRWAGRLIQMQNLPQNHIKDLEYAREAYKTGDYDLISLLYEDVSEMLSQLIRTAFVAKEGHSFAVADFSAIEARVLAWLAGEEWRLEVFRGHGRIYEASASMMFGVPVEEIGKGSDLRQKGKVAELALGYQGSIGALKTMGAEEMGLSEEEMGHIVRTWRAKSPNIVRLWKSVEAAVLKVVENSGSITLNRYKGLRVASNREVLTIQLPSGRKLFYQKPRLTINKFGMQSVKYQGVKEGRWQWIGSYGGKFVENITQAVARDLLAHAMLIMDNHDLPIVMHVHDEAVAEVPADKARESLELMCDIMGEGPDWSIGLPLGAEGFVTPFYKKD